MCSQIYNDSYNGTLVEQGFVLELVITYLYHISINKIGNL